MQIASGAGISKSENKERRKKLLGTRAFGHMAGSSPCGVLILGLHLQFLSSSPSLSPELGIELGLSQNHLDQSLVENMDFRAHSTPPLQR